MIRWRMLRSGFKGKAMGDDSVRLLSNDDLRAACDMRSCIAALDEGIAAMASRGAIRRPRIDLLAPTSRTGEYSSFSTMDGLMTNKYYALRIKPDIISWPMVDGSRRRVTYCVKPGLYGGLVLLFGAEDARLLAIMNDGYLQHMRVGALAGIGARYLSGRRASVVGMIGSGGMARTYAQAFCLERAIEKIQVYSPNRRNAKQYCGEIGELLGILVELKTTPEEAIADVDIVATCTNSSEPVLFGPWLRRGQYVANATPWEMDESAIQRINVVGYLVERQHLRLEGYSDSDFEVRQSVMCYTAGTAFERSGIPCEERSHQVPFAHADWRACVDWQTGVGVAGVGDDDISVLSELAMMVSPVKVGLRSNLASDGIQGIQFASVAGRAYELATARGFGMEIPLAHFLQDIPT
jgi:alanine dehydrogenase